MSWIKRPVITNLSMKAKRSLAATFCEDNFCTASLFDEMKSLQHRAKWAEKTATILSNAANQNRQALDLIDCTNTHAQKVAPDNLRQNIDIPILHIADATASKT